MSKDLRILIRRILKENDDVIDLNVYRSARAKTTKEVLPQKDPLVDLLEKFDKELSNYFELNIEPDLENPRYMAILKISEITKNALNPENEEEFPEIRQDDFLAYMNAVPYEEDEDY